MRYIFVQFVIVNEDIKSDFFFPLYFHIYKKEGNNISTIQQHSADHIYLNIAS